MNGWARERMIMRAGEGGRAGEREGGRGRAGEGGRAGEREGVREGGTRERERE